MTKASLQNLERLRDFLKFQVLQPFIFQVYKPIGYSSYTIADIFKQLLKTKVGHAGTLDPLARGTMVLLSDYATKLTQDFTHKPKKYIIEIVLGIATPSFDLESPFQTPNTPVKLINNIAHPLERVFSELKGTHPYPVPAKSAVKYKGRPLYTMDNPPTIEKKMTIIEYSVQATTPMTVQDLQSKLVHIKTALIENKKQYEELAETMQILTRPRQVTLFDNLIHKLESNLSQLENLEDLELVQAKVELVVSSGTYIRSIAQKVSEMLKIPLTIVDIERV